MYRRRGVGDSSDEEDNVQDSSNPIQESTTSTNDPHPPDHDHEDDPQSESENSDEDDINPGADSSSEGSEEDENEAAEIRDGFIVDSDEESGSESRRKHRKKRRRAHPSNEEIQLDEDDLDILGAGRQSTSDTRFKRLKKANSDNRKKGLETMFDDAESEEEQDRDTNKGGEFDDFIEADEFSEDEEEKMRRQEEREIGQRKAAAKPGFATIGNLAGLNEEKLSEIYDVFGDGDMYDWALAGEEDMENANPADSLEDLTITDVFEPSELSSKMLTEEDNAVRVEDLPERYQILRNRLNHSYQLEDVDYLEKKEWICSSFLKTKDLDLDLHDLCRSAVSSVVDFIAKENLEVPFIWHNRQDYLVNFNGKDSDAEKTQLLGLNDLWHILDLDMDFHALTERRTAAKNLAKLVNDDDVIAKCEDVLAAGVEYQDLIDYLQFTHSSNLKQQKRHSRFGRFDRIRLSSAMELVAVLGVEPEQVKQQLSTDNSENFSTIYQESPDTLPSKLAEEKQCNLEDAESFAITALNFDPDLRKFFRKQFHDFAKIDLVVTDDGRKKITSNSPFADLKYSCNWTLAELRSDPALFLRMLRAEEQGLLIVRAQYPKYKSTLYKDFERLVGGDIDTPWGQVRSKIAKAVSRFVVPLVARNVLESLRSDCVRLLRTEVRKEFARRLDQAPYKPPGYVLGTIPRVMCISSGEGNITDAVLATVVNEDGHVSEAIKLGDAKSPDFAEKLISACRDAQPDVVGVAGFTPIARRLFQDVKRYLVDQGQLTAGPEDAAVPLEVIWVNDEVARLYRNSDRAAEEFPDLVPNARYCVSCARYIQGPLLEYAQLNTSQLRSLAIHPNQFLLPDEDFAWAIETSFVDYVCYEGVDLNQAVRSQYHASVLPYISGLGPRKAQGITQALLSRARGGRIVARSELVTFEITTGNIFMNCASFIRIPWSSTPDESAEYLDSTRIHPEDYELARKMCADALEYDEEDVLAVEENTTGGIVAKLLEVDPEGTKLDELVLEEYAAELNQLFQLRKRVTLNQIRSELQDAYAEKRDFFHILTSDDVFTMLTGQTRETFSTGLVVSAVVKRATGRQLLLNMSGGVDGVAESGYISDDRSIPIQQQFAPGQAVQAEIRNVDYFALYAEANTKSSAVTAALKRNEEHIKATRDVNHWNAKAEEHDIELERRKAEQKQRQLRIVKHPLFKPISAQEAENFLAPLQRGDLVIRPSSRGTDHLVVTWKVSEQIYQHISVKELEKPNEYAVGKILQVGPYRYSDLDELILMHVQATVRKIDEVCASDKFQKGNKKDVERWLQAYTNARPTQSVYAFCFDHRRPGYLLLCYMLGANQPMQELHVRVLPNGYELLGNAYPDVPSLTNGFKMMVQRSKV